MLVVLATLEPVQRVGEHADAAVLRWLAERRTEWLTDVMVAVDRFFSGWPTTVVGASMVLALVVLRRRQRLPTWIISLFVLEVAGTILWQNISRPRPLDVTTVGRWSGWSMPSPPIAVVTAVLGGVTYTLVVAGRPRTLAKWATAGLLAPADLPMDGSPGCAAHDLMVLVAQSQPAASELPCIATLPSGWELEDIHVQRDGTTFGIGSDGSGIEVALKREGACRVREAQSAPSDGAGTGRSDRLEPRTGAPEMRYVSVPGGCVTYLDLCGAGVPCPGGTRP